MRPRAISEPRRGHFNTRSRTIKTIYLLRHAEAGPAGGLSDEERALTPTGVETCRKLRAHLEAEGANFDRILCSSARRAIDTCNLVVGEGRAEIDPVLYLAGTETLFARIRALDESVTSLLVVGHNPGLQAFAIQLIGARGGRHARRLRRDFPPGALATLATEAATWRGFAPNGAQLTAFVTPKNIK